MIEEKIFISTGKDRLFTLNIIFNSKESEKKIKAFDVEYNIDKSIYKIVSQEKNKIIYHNDRDNIKKICHKDVSPFFYYLDFFKEHSTYQHDIKVVENCIEIMQYLLPIPFKAHQVNGGDMKLGIKSYEYYTEKHYINNKEIYPIKIDCKQKQTELYGELYDRFYSLFPKNTLVITTLPQESIEFMQSPNNITFAFCTDLNPLYLTTQSGIEKGDIYNCHHRYNDKNLVENYPELATDIGFINGVRDILCEKTYYDMFHDQLVNHKLVYESLLDKKIIENLDYCNEKGISDISYELNQIQEYYQKNKDNINYSKFGQFLETLYM